MSEGEGREGEGERGREGGKEDRRQAVEAIKLLTTFT